MQQTSVNLSKKLLQSSKPQPTGIVEVVKSNRPGVVAEELKKKLIDFVRHSGDDSRSRSRHSSKNNSLEGSLTALRMGAKMNQKTIEVPKEKKSKPKILRKSVKVLNTEQR